MARPFWCPYMNVEIAGIIMQSLQRPLEPNSKFGLRFPMSNVIIYLTQIFTYCSLELLNIYTTLTFCTLYVKFYILFMLSFINNSYLSYLFEMEIPLL